MSQTPHFNLDYLMPEQAQKHVTVNDAMRRLDALVHLSVKSRSLTAPPTDPKNGDRFLIAANATGDWLAQDGKLASYEDTAWHFFTPQAGWQLFDEAGGEMFLFDGAAWKTRETPAAAPTGIIENKQIELTLTDAKGGFFIPSHVIFLGVTARVTQAVTGATAWDLGVADDLKRFGRDLPLAAQSQISGPADPSHIYWQDTDIVLTPQGGTFTGGRIALALYFIRLPMPETADS